MNTVRLAVVGAGQQSTNALMPALPFIDEIELVAICDLQPALAARNARHFGARAAHTDVTEMLRQEAPDAVMVIGPPQIHEELGLEVLAAGAHLWIEKPAAPTVAGAKRLVDAAREAGRMGQVGHMMRHADPVRIAWELAHGEGFGRILSVESRYTTWPTATIGPGQGWGDADEDWIYMLVQGGHPIDLLRYFLGDIMRVAAFRSHGRGNTKVYQVAVEGRDGKSGFLNMQDSYDGWSTGLEVVGDGQAVVRVDDLGRVSYRAGEQRTAAERESRGTTGYTWEPHHRLPHWQRSGYGPQLRHFARSILAGTPPMPSLWDGWRNLVVAQAILESCLTHQVVDIPQEE